VSEIQDLIIEKYMIADAEELASWIDFYCESCSLVKQTVLLFQQNEDGILLESPPRKPDFNLDFPERLTKKLYLSVIGKIFAVMRYKVYTGVRKLIR
jgi:hypothetical protein